jgi:hypothetical protein
VTRVEGTPTDHCGIQPLTSFGHIGETDAPQHSTTPTRDAHIPGRSVPFHPSATTPVRGTVVSMQETSSPSIRTANVGVRRSKCSSLLHDSPVRAGYSLSMRQIFEVASLQHVPHSHDRTIVYPRLPSVSRSLFNAPAEVTSHQDSSAGCPEHTKPTAAVPDYDSQQKKMCRTSSVSLIAGSEGSWSGDSGYLRAEAELAAPSPVSPSLYNVRDWLCSVALELDAPSPEIQTSCNDTSLTKTSAPATPPSLRTENSFQDTFDDAASSYAWKDETLLPPATPVLARKPQPDATRRHIDNTEVEDDETDLSPLSPNVCVERGPSRHRSSRRRRKLGTDKQTPTKAKPVARRSPPRGENAAHCQSHTRNRTTFWRSSGKVSHTGLAVNSNNNVMPRLRGAGEGQDEDQNDIRT